MACDGLTFRSMLSTPYGPRFNVIYVYYTYIWFFGNSVFEFSSHDFIHGTLYWDYLEKIHLEGHGLLYKSEASLQIPKPGRSLENIKRLQGRCK